MFGQTYYVPERIEPKSDGAREYLAGGYRFRVSEMEVY